MFNFILLLFSSFSIIWFKCFVIDWNVSSNIFTVSILFNKIFLNFLWILLWILQYPLISYYYYSYLIVSNDLLTIWLRSGNNLFCIRLQSPHDLLYICLQSAHDFVTICLWFGHDLVMTCAISHHNLFMINFVFYLKPIL